MDVMRTVAQGFNWAARHKVAAAVIAFNVYTAGNWVFDTNKEHDQVNPEGTKADEWLYTYKDSAEDVAGATKDTVIFLAKLSWNIATGAWEGVFGDDNKAEKKIAVNLTAPGPTAPRLQPI